MKKYCFRSSSFTIPVGHSIYGHFRLRNPITLQITPRVQEKILNAIQARDEIWESIWEGDTCISHVSCTLDPDEWGWAVEDEISLRLTIDSVGKPHLMGYVDVGYGERDEDGYWDWDEEDAFRVDLTYLLVSVNERSNSLIRFNITR